MSEQPPAFIYVLYILFFFTIISNVVTLTYGL